MPPRFTLWPMLFGGRPMRCLRPCCFIDLISGEPVGLYQDKRNRLWMATGRWAWFRVPSEPGVWTTLYPEQAA